MINQAVNRATGTLASRVEHYTSIARDISDVLRKRGEPQAARTLQLLVRRGDDFGRYLRKKRAAAMWNDAQNRARGRVWILAGAGFLGGLALARTIRIAAVDYETRRDSWDELPDYRDAYAQPYAMRPGSRQ